MIPTHEGLEKIGDIGRFKKCNLSKDYIEKLGICEKLIGYELFEKLHANCKVCLLNSNKCEKMKKFFQQTMDQGLVQIGCSKKGEDLSAIEPQGAHPLRSLIKEERFRHRFRYLFRQLFRFQFKDLFKYQCHRHTLLSSMFLHHSHLKVLNQYHGTIILRHMWQRSH